MLLGRWFTCALLISLATVSCAEQGSEEATSPAAHGFDQPLENVRAYPVIASEVAVGHNRLLVGLKNANDAPIGSPRIDVHIDFYDLSESSEDPVTATDMEFLWIDKPYKGIYQGEVEFDSPGDWGAEVAIEGTRFDETVRTRFEVLEEPSTPAIGERAPAVDTKTAADGGLEAITTDRHPAPRFYETSIAQALERGQPFVVVFGTPKYCASQACGPMLEQVKDVAPDFPRVTFIHVEIYEKLEPTSPVVDAVAEWGLPSEPWTFVVDERGRVAAKYEGALDSVDLRRQLERL